MQKFMARQPIMDRRQKVYGYELLFRESLDNFFTSPEDPDKASSWVVADSFLLFGMKTLTNSKKAFINFTENLIVNKCATLLPKDQVVIEVLENVRPTEPVVDACRAMKRQGYLLALDDFVHSDSLEPLIGLADIIKVDFLKTPPRVCEELARRYASADIRLLAEKVESRQQFREARAMGYQYFQGYFFQKPEMFSKMDMPACKLNYMWLLQAIHRPEPDFAEIEQVIKHEPSLCFKLLRYLNSALFGFTREIQSIGHALTLMGLNEVRKWTSLIALVGIGEDKPAALILTAMTRAKFCESLATMAGLRNKALDFFLTGLLSVVDSILERPMPEILGSLSVADEVKVALLQGENALSHALELAVAIEKANWIRISQLASSRRLSEAEISEAYLAAVEWGHEVFDVDKVALTA